MYRLGFIVLLLINFAWNESSAQSHGKIIVKGKVLDSLSSSPLGFATIRIFDSADKKLINGNIPTKKENFPWSCRPAHITQK